MCAGRPPFRGKHRGHSPVCEDTPRPLTEINPDPRSIEVIDRLIAKDADERFQSAGEMAELPNSIGRSAAPTVIPQPEQIARPRPVRPHVTSPQRRWLTGLRPPYCCCVPAWAWPRPLA
jgi:serine/threonine protein kinase